MMVDSDLDTQKELGEAINNLRNGHADKTVITCQNFLITNPSSGAHIQLLAHALIKLGRLNDAQEQIEFAIKLTPDFAGLHEDLGSIQALKNNHDLAIDSFRRAVQIDPTLTSAHKKLAQCLSAIGKNDEVDEAFENYLDRDENAALVAEGAEHWIAGRITDAESTLKSALKKNVNNVDAMHFLALIYHDENNILHRIIKNNDFSLNDVVKTNSPSMDSTISSNFERLLCDFISPSDLDDLYQKMPNNKHSKSINSEIHEQLSQKFLSISVNSNEVEKQIESLYKNLNILIDPHTAVGVMGAEKLNLKNVACLACAHPVKFQETVRQSLQQDIQYDKNFKFDQNEKFNVLDNNYLLLKEYIQNHA